MGKSRRKHPICGNTTAASEKKDKQKASQKARRSLKRELMTAYINEDEEALDLVSSKDPKEYADAWMFNKDGKQYFGGSENEEKLMRK